MCNGLANFGKCVRRLLIKVFVIIDLNHSRLADNMPSEISGSEHFSGRPLDEKAVASFGAVGNRGADYV